jgi:hypothetical protein
MMPWSAILASTYMDARYWEDTIGVPIADRSEPDQS